MTERERVVSYLNERLVESYNGRKMEYANGFNCLITTIENMTDEEYRQLGERDVQPA